MPELSEYEARREKLKERYMADDRPVGQAVGTGGVDHLALICSDMDSTIQFYTEVLGMRLAKVIQNRDDPTSTHIFLDMGGGNMMAFFDFPEHSQDAVKRGIGAMHHVALKAEPAQYHALLARLKKTDVTYSLHGTEELGSVYMRDPDNILVEVTTGY